MSQEDKMFVANIYNEKFEQTGIMVDGSYWTFVEFSDATEYYHEMCEVYELRGEEKDEFASFVIGEKKGEEVRLFEMMDREDIVGVVGFKKQASGNIGTHLYIFPERRKTWFRRSLIKDFHGLIKILYPEVRILASTSERSVTKLLPLLGFKKFLSHGNVSHWYLEPIKEEFDVEFV